MATGPFTLWEGSKQVGVVNGYDDLLTAKAAAQAMADADKTTVMVHDVTGAMMTSVVPGGPTPPAPDPCPGCGGGGLAAMLQSMAGGFSVTVTFAPGVPAAAIPAPVTPSIFCVLLSIVAMIDPSLQPEITLLKNLLQCSGKPALGAQLPQASPGLCSALSMFGPIVSMLFPPLAPALALLKLILRCP